MKIRTHITGTMTNPKIEVDQTWCPGKVDPFIFDCTHYSMQVSFPSRVTKYLVCPPIPPLSHLAIIMKITVITACRSSTFLPPPTILFYTSLSALSHLPSTLPVHLLSANSILSAPILSYLSANSAAYLSTPFPDYDITYLHDPNHILILRINPILAYYLSSYFYPTHFQRSSSFFTLSQI